MPRIPQITTKADLPAEHHAVFDMVAESRDSVRGPFTILLHSPDLCERVTNTGTYLRFQSLVKSRQGELAIIAVAREKDCGYVYAAHVKLAREGGVPEPAIEAVRNKKELSALNEDDAAIVTYVRQLLQKNRVDQQIFDQLQKAHGTQWLVELTGIIGHYSLMTATLNAFEVLPPEDAEHLPL